MKKHTVKLLALLLALAMMLSLAACGSEQKKLVGTWEGTLDLASAYNEAMSAEAIVDQYLTIDELNIVVLMTFREDGTYDMTVTDESIDNVMVHLREVFKQGIGEYLMMILGEDVDGMTLDEVLEMLEFDLDAMVEESITPEMIEELSSELTASGTFSAEDGKLYMSDGFGEGEVATFDFYSLEGDTLTLESSGVADESTEMMYPMVFRRVK